LYLQDDTDTIDPPKTSSTNQESSSVSQEPSSEKLFVPKVVDGLATSKLTELDVEINSNAIEAVNEWLKTVQHSTFPTGMDRATSWLETTLDKAAQVKFLEEKINQEMEAWRVREENESKKKMDNEEYDREKKSYLDFFHNPHSKYVPPSKVNSTSKPESAKRSRETVKLFQDEQAELQSNKSKYKRCIYQQTDFRNSSRRTPK
jgi:hypothetical protein